MPGNERSSYQAGSGLISSKQNVSGSLMERMLHGPPSASKRGVGAMAQKSKSESAKGYGLSVGIAIGLVIGAGVGVALYNISTG
ncbi:MAG: hypothetical protein ABI901_18395, partial [Roseiflexaceae bacterium]